ncbi:hypothetical protein M569_16376 [Genlisea aurea]|uniref:C2 NT-type domain-containing protein n=1 Tax=Genlisea aurea TaxID=192259 RepID=S8D715_9LAMI|nr:hypothetical protein M569_16376 [Genlisea aurea]
MAGKEYRSNTQMLQELEELSENLYQPRSRRNASLALPRDGSVAGVENESGAGGRSGVGVVTNPRTRARRMSLSPWRGRAAEEDGGRMEPSRVSSAMESGGGKWSDEVRAEKKGGIWNWKPIRALTHIGMQKLSCLFSVEVVAVQNLPPSMNGLRLAVCVRKKETKDGAVQTMPSRVSDGVADFEETLFLRCNAYFTPGSGVQMKFEPRPFLIHVAAVDAGELDFGRSSVDLSTLIQESIEKSFEGTRIRQWDTSFTLSGKAKGGELILKLGFQIMDKDGGLNIYSHAEGQKQVPRNAARKQSKTSFSVLSPRLSAARSPKASLNATASELQEMDDLNLDEPAPPPPPPQPPSQSDSNLKNANEVADENDFPEFDVVDKGVEFQGKASDAEEEDDERQSSEVCSSDKRSVSSEVVKEVIQDQYHSTRLSELDSIAEQIKALESMMESDESEPITPTQALDADEAKVTREFLRLLEEKKMKNDVKDDDKVDLPEVKSESNDEEDDSEAVYLLPDLGKGLGCVVQTRNGGFLAAMNPLETPVARKDIPKLAMQLSKPLVIHTDGASGFEVFQKMAAAGLQEFTSEMLSVMPIDELVGKTAEQMAFEGIASAIILGRNREGASSSAARTIAAVKSMAGVMNSGRKERLATGIWNLNEDPLTADEILPFSMQKIESMALDALKIQADSAEEEAPFDVSPIISAGKSSDHLLASATPVEDWIKDDDADDTNNSMITISVIVQLRDPAREYEAVGGPVVALIHAAADEKSSDGEKKYKVASLQLGGVKLRNASSKNSWDGEKQKLTALQWLVAHGVVKSAAKKGKRPPPAKGSDVLWSLAARVMADMWLKHIRNPDVKFTN